MKEMLVKWVMETLLFHFSKIVYETKGMKFCTQVPITCVHKRLVLDFRFINV